MPKHLVYFSKPWLRWLKEHTHPSPHKHKSRIVHHTRRAHARAHAKVIKAQHPFLAPRQRVVKWAWWGVKHSACFDYTESGSRDDWLKLKPGHLLLPSNKIDTDCSGFVTLCYKWAGLTDPNGLKYAYLGYTGTLLSYAQKVGRIVSTAMGLPGDPLVYGPDTGWHTAILLTQGPDPLTATHGGPGVQAIHVSQDGRQPQRVCQTLIKDKELAHSA